LGVEIEVDGGSLLMGHRQQPRLVQSDTLKHRFFAFEVLIPHSSRRLKKCRAAFLIRNYLKVHAE